MNIEEKKKELSSYRIKQAEECLDEANFLLEGGKSPRSIANRAYYSMFYSVLALLVYEKYSSSKHSGVLSYFNKRFIKEGVFDKSMGRALNRAFALRQRGDYREHAQLSYEQVKPLIQEAGIFVKSIKEYLKNRKN